MTDAPTEGELLPATTSAIAEYTPTAAALAELRQQLAGKTFDCTTAAGDREARQSRRVLVELRTRLEDRRQELKKPLLDRGRLLDTEAKAITAQILELEQPIDQQIRAEEARKQAIKDEAERRERARLAAIDAEIHGIQNLPLTLVGADPAAIERALEDLTARSLEHIDEDRRGLAVNAQRQALGQLSAMLEQAQAAAKQAEALAAERAENERIRREAAAREAAAAEAARAERAQRQARDGALQAIRDYPADHIGKGSGDLRAAIAHAQRRPVDAVLQADPEDAALAAELWQRAEARLQTALEVALEREAEQAEVARLRAAEEARQADAARAAEEARRVAEELDAEQARARAAAEAAQQAEQQRRREEAGHRRWLLVGVAPEGFEEAIFNLVDYGTVVEVSVDTLDDGLIDQVIAVHAAPERLKNLVDYGTNPATEAAIADSYAGKVAAAPSVAALVKSARKPRAKKGGKA